MELNMLEELETVDAPDLGDFLVGFSIGLGTVAAGVGIVAGCVAIT